MAEPDILLVGPYPPPFGGISAHVERLVRAIRAQGLSVRVINHFNGQCDDLIIANLSRNPWCYWRTLRIAEGRVVHYHHSRWSTLMATALALRRSPAATVVTVHGRDLEHCLRSRIPGLAGSTRRALRTFDVLIAVSVEIELALRGIGPPVEVIPAYLPVQDDSAHLSAPAQAFLHRGRNLVVAAYRLTVDGQGRTIYGLETAVQSFVPLAAAQPDLQLAIFLAAAPRSHRESQRLRSLFTEVHDEDVRRRIGVFCGEPLTAALPLTEVYLRPTLTDGDAVSIREAIAAGVPVLASDVVQRPAGVRTLGLEIPAWTAAIRQSLGGPRGRAGGTPAADAVADLMTVYRRLGCSAPMSGTGILTA